MYRIHPEPVHRRPLSGTQRAMAMLSNPASFDPAATLAAVETERLALKKRILALYICTYILISGLVYPQATLWRPARDCHAIKSGELRPSSHTRGSRNGATGTQKAHPRARAARSARAHGARRRVGCERAACEARGAEEGRAADGELGRGGAATAWRVRALAIYIFIYLCIHAFMHSFRCIFIYIYIYVCVCAARAARGAEEGRAADG